MGSSARKKAEKKKDFQKTKLKVGKTKAKPDNFTDTSFKAKSITVNQQSLTTSAPSTSEQLTHYLSLASSSKSDTQRRDALAYLTTQLSSQPVDKPFPLPSAILLPKLLPLILDGSQSVRTQLLKFFRLLPHRDVADRAESALLYVRAGISHLATEIRNDALSVLEWLLEIAEDDVVSCPGGWVKTLNCFMSMMGWAVSKTPSKWTAASKASFGSKSGKSFPKQILVLAQFLNAGLVEEPREPEPPKPNLVNWMIPAYFTDALMLPTKTNPYAHLNLFGPPRDEEGEMYMSREGRQRVFHKNFAVPVKAGVEIAKKEGGETGRAAAILAKVLKEGMDDYSATDDTL